MHIREQGILTISHIKILPYILNNACREEIVNVQGWFTQTGQF